MLCRVLPDLYAEDTEVTVHPYFASGLLFVSVTTLVLFFASGMYSEKIGYANRYVLRTPPFPQRTDHCLFRYVPHANRALRSFNMYLNVRQPPMQSRFPFNLFSFLFPRPAPVPPPPSRRSRNPSPSPPPSKRSSSIPIAPIPPTSNPRGELIFSSRVDRTFRDSYERYRSAFERRRDEREREVFVKTWKGWIYYKIPWVKHPPPGGSAPGLGSSISRTGSGSLRGRGSGGPTPSTSRRSSPMPSRTPRQGSYRGTRAQTPPIGQQHPLASATHTSDRDG